MIRGEMNTQVTKLKLETIVGDSKNLAEEIDEHDLIRIADYVRYVVKACGKRAVLTLHDARLCDSNGVYWKRFMESHKQKS